MDISERDIAKYGLFALAIIGATIGLVLEARRHNKRHPNRSLLSPTHSIDAWKASELYPVVLAVIVMFVLFNVIWPKA